MARIRLHKYVKVLIPLCFPYQCIIFKIMVRLLHPVCTVRAEGLAIYKQTGFPARSQIKHNPFPFCLFRQCKISRKPAVLVLLPPDKSGFCRNERFPQHLFPVHLLHGTIRGPPDLSQRLIKISLQCAHPMLQSVSPFRMHDAHCMFSLL